jgi:succinate dehydrogenase / fumarate reductase membrane anchor subunit
MSGGGSSMRTALGRVKGAGASGEGTGHFIASRVTAVALAILAPWFVITAALTMPDAGYGSAIEFVSQPLNSVGLILLIVIGLYHMSLGMQEVIVDYIGKPFTKFVLLLLNALGPLAIGAAAIFAVLRVNFGA